MRQQLTLKDKAIRAMTLFWAIGWPILAIAIPAYRNILTGQPSFAVPLIGLAIWMLAPIAAGYVVKRWRDHNNDVSKL